MKSQNTFRLVLTGILSALVFVVTSFTMIKVPFVVVKEAYFHAGDSIIFLSGLVLGGPVAAFVSGIGSFLADVYLGAPQYMLATLVIKAVMGGIAGYFLYNSGGAPSTKKTILGLTLAGIWMAVGYYFYEVLLLGINWIANLPNLFTNICQAALGAVLYLPLSQAIIKSKTLLKYL